MQPCIWLQTQAVLQPGQRLWWMADLRFSNQL
jgi:hypothetical protein